MQLSCFGFFLVAVSDAARIGGYSFTCPPGLDANRTDETCIWGGGFLHDPDTEHEQLWVRGSEHPLVFEPWGGLVDAQGEVLKEIHYVASHPDFIPHMCKHINSHVKHSTIVLHRLKENSENLEAIVAVADKIEEELIVEGVVSGLTVLSHATILAGHATTKLVVQDALGLTKLVSEVLGSPIVVGVTALHSAYLLRKHYHHKDTRARHFAIALVSKPNCLLSKLQSPSDDSFEFIPELHDVCGAGVVAVLEETMTRTYHALMHLLKEFKGMGKCMFPEGRRAWSKSNCANAVYEPLREHEGQSGILYTAISMASAYGRETDQLLNTPFYSQWFAKYLGMDLPATTAVSDQLRTQSMSGNERATTCSMIVAVHQGFGRAFLRLRTALTVYMRTFAREELHFSTRTSQHPCRKIFRKMADGGEAFCKESHEYHENDTPWIEKRSDVSTGEVANDANLCFEDAHPDVNFAIFSSVDDDDNENNEEQ